MSYREQIDAITPPAGTVERRDFLKSMIEAAADAVLEHSEFNEGHATIGLSALFALAVNRIKQRRGKTVQ